MSFEYPCLFCVTKRSVANLSTFGPESSTPGYYEKVYGFLCDIIGANFGSLDDQNYFIRLNKYLLPLCPQCSSLLKNVANLQKQLEELQQKIHSIGNEIQSTIQNSEKYAQSTFDLFSGGGQPFPTWITWMNTFRQLVIKNKSKEFSWRVQGSLSPQKSAEITPSFPVFVKQTACIEGTEEFLTLVAHEATISASGNNINENTQQQELIVPDNEDDHFEPPSPSDNFEDQENFNESSNSDSDWRDERPSQNVAKSRKRSNPKVSSTSPKRRKKSRDIKSDISKIKSRNRKVPLTAQELARRKFKCHKCPKGFTTKDQLARHLFRHFDVKSFSCNFCEEKFFEVKELRNHNKKAHGTGAPFQCSICSTKRVTEGALRSHMKTHEVEGPGPFTCTSCPEPKIYQHKAAFKRHLRTHQLGKCFSCPFLPCEAKSSRKEDLVRHMIRKHKNATLAEGQSSFDCNRCLEVYSDPMALITHIIIHGGVKELKCVLCQLTFVTQEEFNKHNEMTHGFEITRLPCLHCPLVFTSKKLLAQHSLLHKPSLNKRVTCTICDQSLFDAKTLVRHTSRCHDPNKPVRLKVKRTPKAKSDDGKEKETVFICGECSITFSSINNLKRHHKTIHSDDRPFKCEVEDCDKTFKRKDDRKKHVRLSHAEGATKKNKTSELKVYKCELCENDQIFQSKMSLKRHKESIHSDERRYQCDSKGCEKSFKRKDDMYKHFRRAHPAENRIPIERKSKASTKCEICDENFDTKFFLKIHFLSDKHKEKLKEKQLNKSFVLVERLEDLECIYCGQYQKSSKALKKHVLSHTGFVTTNKKDGKDVKFKIVVQELLPPRDVNYEDVFAVSSDDEKSSCSKKKGESDNDNDKDDDEESSLKSEDKTRNYEKVVDGNPSFVLVSPHHIAAEVEIPFNQINP